MTKHEQDLFYIGAAMFLNLDSDEVDTILANAGLATATHSVEECREAIKNRYPDRYEAGKGLKPETWLTVSEAAEQWNVSVATIRRAASRGHIRGAEKQAGRWRFPQRTFLYWLSHRPRPGPKARRKQ